jgi:Holliday junction DNA helicase RuvA
VIAGLKGIVAEKNLSDAVIDVNGVGYRVNLSLLTLSSLPEVGQGVALRIRTVVREDAFDLFGFLSRTEEELFLMLTSVSHVGPKVAMNVLSGLEVDELVAAIAKGDVARLTKIHGVGRKTAERLVLELKEKVKTIALEAKPGAKRPALRSPRVMWRG